MVEANRVSLSLIQKNWLHLSFFQQANFTILHVTDFILIYLSRKATSTVTMVARNKDK